MASHQLLEQIVRSGANLVLQSGPAEELMRQLARLAAESGAHITVPNAFSEDFTAELLRLAAKQITFVESAGDQIASKGLEA